MTELRLRYVELYNWTSYWNAPIGEEGSTPHCFDFNSKSGKNGFVIFGENSRGKSSFTDAIQWLLFGKAWTKPVSSDGGNTVKKTLRPLVGHPENKTFPLLNTTSFLEENFNFFVTAIFDMDGDIYQLIRTASPKEEGLVVEDDDDMDVTIQIKNASTKELWRGDAAKDFINSQILPEKLSRFFFLDGESVTDYRTLIASSEENIELRRNIEDILNFPILKKGISDFGQVKNGILDEFTSNTKSTTKNKKLLTRINVIKNDIEKIGISDKANKKLKQQKKEAILKLETKMSEFGSAEQIIIDRDKEQVRLEGKESRLSELYDDRKRDNQDLWISILQKSVKDEIHDLQPEIEKRKGLEENIRIQKTRLKYLKNLSLDEKIPCETCEQLPIARSKKQIKKDDIEKGKVRDQLDELDVLITNNDVLQKKSRLEKYKAYIRVNFTAQKERINLVNGEIDDIKEKMTDYQTAIDDIDEEEVAGVREQIKNLEGELADCRAKERSDSKEIEILNIEKSEKNRRVIEAGGDVLLKKLEAKIELVEWFEKIWTQALDRFSQECRTKVEISASDIFKQLTNNPEGFSRIILNESFGLTVLDSNELPVQNPTPGMMQVAAISLIDALGLMSNIEFPILFDTPGQSIDQGHRNNIIEHYWKERATQFIIIPSSGEFRADEVETQYNDLIARTWELDFDSKENKTTVKNRVMN